MKSTHLLDEEDAGLEVTGKSGKLPPRGPETEKQNHVKRSTHEQRQRIVAIVSRLDLVITLKAPEDVTAYRDRSGVAADEEDSPRHRTPSISDVHVKLTRLHEHVIQTEDPSGRCYPFCGIIDASSLLAGDTCKDDRNQSWIASHTACYTRSRSSPEIERSEHGED